MHTLTYFAYGSNMLTERLQRRVPSATPVGSAICEGYALAFHKKGRDGSAKCSIVEREDAHVHGVIFELDAAERELLDRAEGLGAGYDLVDLEVGRGESLIEVFSYRAQQAYVDDALRAFDWYHALVLAGAREHALPPDYVDRIVSVESKPDYDAERAARNRQTIDAARRTT